MCYLMFSTSLSVSPRNADRKAEPSAREQVSHLVPHPVPSPVTAKRGRRGELRPAGQPESDAAKTIPWPGATPFCGAFRAPKPLRAAGVAPGHEAAKHAAEFVGVARR